MSNAIRNEWLKVEAFEKAVKKAKVLVTTMKASQLEIAKLALSVCEFRARSEDALSFSRFADQVGVSKSSLSQWISAYQLGAKKLNPKNPTKVPYTAARLVVKEDLYRKKNGGKPTSPNAAKAIVSQHKCNERRKNLEFYGFDYLNNTRKIKNMIEAQGADKIPQGIKTELKILLKQVLKKLESKK